ncbi:hypothetical protein RRG08_046062 [Elysia crispata]|uniref:Uncharacterized protein n=1 Tax=Elysia crispata TaxID=231223 RepID=A0AAE1CUJ4_9GAST|nr:hypothetical protein RRG08_046062 [Elysia crispata]
MLRCYQSMKLCNLGALGQCGVAQIGWSWPGWGRRRAPCLERRFPPYAADCDSDSLAVARGQQSRTTGHLLRDSFTWNAGEVRQKK